MTKVLITPKNSIWGVIINPQSSNTYRHALNFPTPQIKEAFINKELFNDGDDYKALLAATPERAFTRLTATSAEFVVEVSEYPNETFVSLLNKDFCIIEEDGVEQFYTLSGKRNGNGNTIIYTAELDIFFTYGIKDMFNDKETEIKRGMFDRFIKNTAGAVVPRDNYLNTPLINKESFDGDFSNLRFPTLETTPILSVSPVKINFVARPGTPDATPDQQAEIIQRFLEMKWQLLTEAVDPAGTIPNLTPNTFSGTSTSAFDDNNTNIIEVNPYPELKYAPRISMPFIHLLAPLARDLQIPAEFSKNFSVEVNLSQEIVSEYSTDINQGDKFIATLAPFTPTFLAHAETLKNTLTVLPLSPLEMFKDLRVQIFTRISPTHADFSLQFLDSRIFGPGGVTDVPTTYGTFHYDWRSSHFGALGIRLISKNNSEVKAPFTISPEQISLDPSNPKSLSNEPKLNFSPYTVIEVGSSTKNKSTLLPENFLKNEIVYRSNNSYLTSNWGYLAEFKNYGNINQPSNPFMNAQFNYIVEDFANYQIPTDINKWQEFITRNHSSQTASFLSKGVGVGVGVLGALAAPFTGGASAAAVGLGLASLAAKSSSDINTQIAQRKDIKNSPNEIQGTGTTLPFELVTKPITPYILKKSLEPILKLQIFDHIYKYGYSFDNRLNKINEFLDTRYWFNYIEASDTFENIKLQAAAEIKQLINDTLEQGLTIWHIRDLTTFKGIKNYENENIEISLLTPKGSK